MLASPHSVNLDARSEHEVFERFAELTEGKMALLIVRICGD
jgi:spore coat polysaccharide biosynthesis protein SpsF (cytidylyltransferase family)